jgi:hypothetical protein
MTTVLPVIARLNGARRDRDLRRVGRANRGAAQQRAEHHGGRCFHGSIVASS